MFYYLEGKLSIIDPTFVVIDIGGVGYHLQISLQTYQAIQGKESTRLFVYNHIKEDAFTLFGFSEVIEKSMFSHLLSVSGIGPNTARLVLSSLTSKELRMAILGEKVEAFKKIKGIGPKTAKRLILDLKDKMQRLGDENVELELSQENRAIDEALMALIALGFQRNAVQKVLKVIENQEENKNLTVESLIKEALKKLS